MEKEEEEEEEEEEEVCLSHVDCSEDPATCL
jgi:hypothetical protein